MNSNLEDIQRQAQALDAEDRAKLAEDLLESLHSPISDIAADWAQEIENRVAAFERGEMQAYPAIDVFVEARHLSR